MISILILIIIFGTLIGSFLNVVIYRIPRGESIVHPRSSCPSCKKLITWYENIPIVSYLFLKGKCKKCGFKIPIRYPLVEALMGLIAFLLFPLGTGAVDFATQMLNYVFQLSIAAVFLAHFLIDIEHKILPDKINLYLLLIVLIYSVFNFPWQHWLIGGAIGFAVPYGITYAFYKLKGQIGLGGGDIKLYGVLGVLFGPIGVFNTLFFSCMLGSVIGTIMIMLKKMDRSTAFAFGPFIIITASLQIFFPSIWEKVNIMSWF